MLITAKYNSMCPTCSCPINAGDMVEWSKGRRATHADCQAEGSRTDRKGSSRSLSRPSRKAPPGPELRNDRSPYVSGSVLVVQLSTAEIAECEARQSIAATEIPGDKPCKRAGDRRVAAVVIHMDRLSTEWADDNGYCGRYGAVVRLATADEAAPLVADRAAKEAAKAEAEAMARRWTLERDERIAGRIYVEMTGPGGRDGAVVLHEERRGYNGTISERWSSLPDGSVMVETFGGDDWRCGRYVTADQLLDMARTASRTLEDAVLGQRYSSLDRAIIWLAHMDGKTPRPPVTVTLHGLADPVILSVRLIAPGQIIAEVSSAASVQVVEVDSLITRYQWTWPISDLRDQLDARPPASAFADIDFAEPDVSVNDQDRLILPGGLWISGMGVALRELCERSR